MSPNDLLAVFWPHLTAEHKQKIQQKIVDFLDEDTLYTPVKPAHGTDLLVVDKLGNHPQD